MSVTQGVSNAVRLTPQRGVSLRHVIRQQPRFRQRRPYRDFVITGERARSQQWGEPLHGFSAAAALKRRVGPAESGGKCSCGHRYTLRREYTWYTGPSGVVQNLACNSLQ